MKSIRQLRQQTGWNCEQLCSLAGLPLTTFHRWSERMEQGLPAIGKPGPKPLVPLELERLLAQLQRLDHGTKRSRGSGALREQYRQQISRRDFRTLVRQARRNLRRQRRQEQCRIRWNLPGVVWSLDDTELVVQRNGGRCKLQLQHAQDLGSRYKFTPLVRKHLPGEVIAARLETLFLRYGPPLVLKRDNGGNLNHRAVDEVLARYLVIPLCSPPYYPPYNGGMEKAQCELKTVLEDKLSLLAEASDAWVQQMAETTIHQLNHQPRPCLQRRTACEAFAVARLHLKMYTRRKRKEILNEIMNLAREIIETPASTTRRHAGAAFRLAVETWLKQHGVITVCQNKTVSPSFQSKNSHK